MKKILGGLFGLVVLAGIGFYLLVANIDGIVKNVVETVGTEVTGTRVRLASVEIDLQSGKGSLKGLTIANPEGFAKGDAFSLAEITLGLDVGTLSKSPVVINQIIVDGATVNYLGQGNKSNLQTILDNLKSGGSDSGSGSGGSGGDDTLIIIDEFRFTDANMTIAMEGVPELNKNVVISDVISKDIGRKAGGVTPAEAATEIMQPIVERAVRQGINAVSDGGLDKAMDKVKGIFGK